MRRFLIIACAVAVMLGLTATSGATAKTRTPAVALRCVAPDGATVVSPCFTTGASADGGGKGITVDNNGPIASVALDNWWCQKVADVQQLKISTQEPVTPGSPRISIYLSDDVTGPAGTDGCNTSTWNTHTLFLSPYYCNSSNSNGWRMSNWRGDSNCTLFYDNEVAGYAGWNAFVAAHPNMYIWFAFVIQDETHSSRIDRIQLDSQLFTR